MEVISSILGVSVKNLGEADLKTESACSLQETNQTLHEATNSGASDLENNDSTKTGGGVNVTCEQPERDSKTDSNISEDIKSARTNTNEKSASSEEKNGCEKTQPSNGDMSATRIVDVINGRFGEGGDTLLHVASRSSRTEIVLRLLECGAVPAVK